MARKRGQVSSPELLRDLALVAQGRRFEESADAWTYGWCLASYRRSPDAAIKVGAGRVRLSDFAVDAFESAMQRLLRIPAAGERWDDQELWGVVAEMVASLPQDIDQGALDAELEERVGQLLSSSPSLVAFALANVAWTRSPLLIADCVIGTADKRWIEAIHAAARNRPTVIPGTRPWWLQDIKTVAEPGSVVAFAAWVPADGTRAIDLAQQRFEDLLCVGLLGHDNPQDIGLHPLRGDSHRPGVRGLTLHRPAFRGAAEIGRELGAEIHVASPIGGRWSVHWYGEDPLPLDLLLASNRTAEIATTVDGQRALDRRLLTAARWLGRAYWSQRAEDAALALGIALDALLAEAGPSPGRVLTERFALLEADISKRSARAHRMDELYGVRSSVAHGGKSSVLDQPGFVQGMANDVRWVASRMRDLGNAVGLATEKDYRQAFEGLKWGNIAWRPSTAGDQRES